MRKSERNGLQTLRNSESGIVVDTSDSKNQFWLGPQVLAPVV